MDSSAIVGVFHAVLFAQEKTVTGVVTDATGPLPGVNVLIKGSRTGVQTNLDGKYSIKANQEMFF
jgi:hypothetical protein